LPGARTLLDVGCGTGGLLAEVSRWYDVAGVDVSPAMLAEARRKLPDTPLVQADMRTFDLGRTFDAITCLFSSIGYMTEEGDLEMAVARMAEHLSPGGIVVIDGWLRPHAWLDGHRPEPEIASDLSTTVVRLAFSRRDGPITTLDMHHLVRTDAGIEYFCEIHRLRLVATADYVAAFEKASLVPRVVPDYIPNRDRVIGIRPHSRN
jgi:SAM-dependent methyltransferase